MCRKCPTKLIGCDVIITYNLEEITLPKRSECWCEFNYLHFGFDLFNVFIGEKTTAVKLILKYEVVRSTKCKFSMGFLNKRKLCSHIYNLKLSRRLNSIKSSQAHSRVNWLQEETDVSGTICPYHRGSDVRTISVPVIMVLTSEPRWWGQRWFPKRRFLPVTNWRGCGPGRFYWIFIFLSVYRQ
jgi:hypothetical protein